MFGISGTELLIIALVALLLFGPDKLPQLGRTVGRVMKQFNEAKDTMEHMVRSEMYGSDDNATPFAPSSPFAKPASSDKPAAVAVTTAEYVDEEEEEEE